MRNRTLIKKDFYYFKTRFTLLWASLLNEPFASLYSMLPFILRKDLGGSALEIVILTMLRPVVSLLSFYWSFDLKSKRYQLRSNLVIAGLLSRLPFLFFPVMQSSWYLIFAGLVYILFSRAAIPAWMEILKLNIPKESREKLFSLGWTIGYVEGILIALGIGALLDTLTYSWKYLFFFSALLGMVSVFLQARVPIRGEEEFALTESEPFTHKRISRPWIEAFQLMRERPDFALFQMGFMAGGFGVMVIHPALPYFLVDDLTLSYLSLGVAITVCKGLGIVFTSPIWARLLSRYPVNRLAGLVCLGFSLFALCLILAPWTLFWVFFAYLLYGIAQGGSHLIWHLSGPHFAQNEESSRYSSVNILMVGLRGLVAPALGALLCSWLGPKATLFIGSLCCGFGTYLLLAYAPLRQKLSN